MRKTWIGALLALSGALLIYGCTQPSAKMADATVKGRSRTGMGTRWPTPPSG